MGLTHLLDLSAALTTLNRRTWCVLAKVQQRKLRKWSQADPGNPQLARHASTIFRARRINQFSESSEFEINSEPRSVSPKDGRTEPVG
jgi:hypothetical protein